MTGTSPHCTKILYKTADISSSDFRKAAQHFETAVLSQAWGPIGVFKGVSSKTLRFISASLSQAMIELMTSVMCFIQVVIKHLKAKIFVPVLGPWHEKHKINEC